MFRSPSIFDLFVNVILGVGLVFELPVLIFFLTLLRLASPAFLVRHSRYAILIIFIIAAVVTPTPDVFNMMLFAVPMCLLFYVGIFGRVPARTASRERKFPWRKDHDYRSTLTTPAGHLGIYRNYEAYGQTSTTLAVHS